MGAKALVLVSKQHGEEARIDIGDARGQPPAPLNGRIGAQQAAVVIDDPRRKRNILAERRRAERCNPPSAGAERGEKNRTREQDNKTNPS
jgi:hypothetical protein